MIPLIAKLGFLKILYSQNIFTGFSKINFEKLCSDLGFLEPGLLEAEAYAKAGANVYMLLFGKVINKTKEQ